MTGLYRAAFKCEDYQIVIEIDELVNIEYNDNDINDNIVAYFELNGKQWILQNGLDNECKFDSNEKVDRLVKEIGYIFDESVGNEIPNKKARELHLKYHTEKKTLAILLFNRVQILTVENGHNMSTLV